MLRLFQCSRPASDTTPLTPGIPYPRRPTAELRHPNADPKATGHSTGAVRTLSRQFDGSSWTGLSNGFISMFICNGMPPPTLKRAIIHGQSMSHKPSSLSTPNRCGRREPPPKDAHDHCKAPEPRQSSSPVRRSLRPHDLCKWERPELYQYSQRERRRQESTTAVAVHAESTTDAPTAKGVGCSLPATESERTITKNARIASQKHETGSRP
ncbi:uncharacterized protein EI97DRAFT_160973 [Westerdykella ornata]|uniref:Uncharacterized protein n=1 Tax=Westerdykella ornata TaxID=318751 RepID=A0A6A6JDP5_WESOR|nr:uncharacterized protein EI97DRAFT_160973 [Westerdykella ornata]KAF2273309.1 hypothetical protein EI97DRAFT_160973 [Westerdykella ornata]